MVRNLSIAAVFGLLTLTATPAETSCIFAGPTHYLVRIQVEECQVLADYAAESIASSGFPWLVSSAERILERNPGVVVSGVATDRLALEQVGREFVVAGPLEYAGSAGKWFVPMADPDCKASAKGALLDAFQSASCCDVYPPSDVPCFFGVTDTRPIPEELEDVLPTQ